MHDSVAMPARGDCVVAPLLERWARERPQRPFLEFDDGGAWTFGAMHARTRRAAAGLRSLGLERGDRLLCWMPNRRETVLGWFAANWLGAIYVPVNTAWRGGLLQHAIALSQAEVMIVDAAWLPQLLDLDWPRLRREQGARLRDVIVVGEAAAPAQAPVAASELRLHRQALLDGPAEVDAEPGVEPWDTNWILFTSGTTGPSKGVLGTYVQAWSGGAMAMDYFGPDDRVLANLPLFHVSGAGAVMDRLTKGGTCVLVDGFSAATFWDVVRRFRITGCCLVGAMTAFLLKRPPDPRDRMHPLRNVITVPWNADSLAVGRRYDIRMHTAFNMTETATPIRSPPDPPRMGSCGQPRPGVEARIVDANDLEVGTGEVGELVLRTARPWEITAGYFRDPVATARAWRNGWFHTGDAFRRDAEGWFYFVDRLKDAIRRRGENISSFEVESEVASHEAVREAAAIPVPSEHGEDEVMVVLALQPGCTLDPAQLLRFLEPRMAHYMLPRYVRVVDALPKTPTAKVEKHRLRAEGVTPDTWDREAHGVTVRRGRLQLPGEGGTIEIHPPPTQTGVPMSPSDDVITLARRFVAAIQAKDVETVRQCYAPGARIWHNVDGKVQSVDDNIKGVHWIHRVLANVQYDVKRLVAIPGGFVQEHVLRGTLASGEAFAMPACVICTVEDGVIVTLDEYLDSAHTKPLVGQAKRSG